MMCVLAQLRVFVDGKGWAPARTRSCACVWMGKGGCLRALSHIRSCLWIRKVWVPARTHSCQCTTQTISGATRTATCSLVARLLCAQLEGIECLGVQKALPSWVSAGAHTTKGEWLRAHASRGGGETG